MSLHTWLAFFVASWLISLSPGPGALSCMTAGLRYGYRRAVWNIFGLQVGVLTLLSVVAAGLGAILAASVVAFDVVKWLGAAYLVWLGIQQWRAGVATSPAEDIPTGSARRQLMVRGFLVNASNPKGILFMLAVLPQFIDPTTPQWPQYVVCAATLVFTDLVVMSSYTLLASRVLRTLHGRHAVAVNRLFGGLFMCAGVLLASFRRT